MKTNSVPFAAFEAAAFNTLTVALTISGPISSPYNTPNLYVVIFQTPLNCFKKSKGVPGDHLDLQEGQPYWGSVQWIIGAEFLKLLCPFSIILAFYKNQIKV
ncbi:hypothetical protein B4100_3513 [Heyndrickxia coagulans]|nr:hypothetical protein B4100_3513 [Heyndrickxia coagulans]